jgi:hypothetical protein
VCLPISLEGLPRLLSRLAPPKSYLRRPRARSRPRPCETLCEEGSGGVGKCSDNDGLKDAVLSNVLGQLGNLFVRDLGSLIYLSACELRGMF